MCQIRHNPTQTKPNKTYINKEKGRFLKKKKIKKINKGMVDKRNEKKALLGKGGWVGQVWYTYSNDERERESEVSCVMNL